MEGGGPAVNQCPACNAHRLTGRHFLIDCTSNMIVARGNTEVELSEVAVALCELNDSSYVVVRVVGVVDPPEKEEHPGSKETVQTVLLRGDVIPPAEMLAWIGDEVVSHGATAMAKGDPMGFAMMAAPFLGMMDALLPRVSGQGASRFRPLKQALEMQYDALRLMRGEDFMGDMDRAIGTWMVTKDMALVVWLVKQARDKTKPQRAQTAQWAISSLADQSPLFMDAALSAGWRREGPTQ
jgi:hypothetical protein